MPPSMSMKIATAREIRRDWIKIYEDLYINQCGHLYFIKEQIFADFTTVKPTVDMNEINMDEIAAELFCGV